MTVTQALDTLMRDFENDPLGGARYLNKVFMDIPEPERSQFYEFIMERRSTFPPEAQKELVWLAFMCRAGADRVGRALEGGLDKLPEGDEKERFKKWIG